MVSLGVDDDAVWMLCGCSRCWGSAFRACWAVAVAVVRRLSTVAVGRRRRSDVDTALCSGTTDAAWSGWAARRRSPPSVVRGTGVHPVQGPNSFSPGSLEFATIDDDGWW